MACPSPEALIDYAGGSGRPESIAAVAAHVDGCEACRRAVVDLLGSTLAAGEPADAPALPRPGDLVGRYRVRAQVGAGGMGVVFAAHDPELDRDVALKLLRVDLFATVEDPEAAGERLRREARAMAKLRHPNLVAAFDIGTHGGRLFIAMELVPRTLRGWLAERPRPWAEIVEVLAGAGRGLAAAHALGIVHRDFKPDNVLVGDDGAARVSDFGLARVGGAARTPVGATSLDGAIAVSRTAELVGTPLYMAPEQLRGERADARSDQFSFCVTLYEALWGKRPYGAGEPPSLRGLLENLDAGRLRPPPPKGTPAWLRAAVLRGLDPHPAARFPSMEALLAALRPPPRRGRALALAATAAAVITVGAVVGVRVASRPPPCAPADPRALFTDDARRALQTAAATPESRAEATAVEAALDRYAAAWVDARLDACRATRVRGEQSEALLDARVRCLDDRALEARATTALFTDARTVATHGREMASRLTPLSACTANGALTGVAPPPADPAQRARYDNVNQQLAAARARYESGDYETAVIETQPVVDAARALGHAPTTARAQLLLGLSLANRQRWDEARRALEEAARFGDEARDDRTRAAALTRLIWVHQAKGDTEALARTEREATSVLQRLDREPDLAYALEIALGSVDFTRGRFTEAEAHTGRAFALAERIFGPDDLRLASAAYNRGAALTELGRFDEAGTLIRRALDIRRRARGPDHADTASTESSYADLLRLTGRHEEALALLAHARPILERAFGVASDYTLQSWRTQSSVYLTIDRFAEALDAADHAVAIAEKVHGPSHDETVFAHQDRAFALVALERWGEARREIDRLEALANARPNDTVGDGKLHGDVALLRILVKQPAKARAPMARARSLASRLHDDEELAVLDRLEGDLTVERAPAVAERWYRSALARFDGGAWKVVDHRVGAALRGLGQALRAQHRPAEALLSLARAATIPHPRSEQQEAILAYDGALLEAIALCCAPSPARRR